MEQPLNPFPKCPETGAALRYGLRHHDGRGCGPHGAGRRDGHAQGLRLGQHQPARVSQGSCWEGGRYLPHSLSLRSKGLSVLVTYQCLR